MNPARFSAKIMRTIWRRSTGLLQTYEPTPTAGVWGAANVGLISNQKMNNKLTARERRHLAAVKEMPCGVCGASGPSDAHHIEQGKQFLCIPLCKDCHQGAHNGIHGQRRIWNVMKKTELSVLNDTIDKLTK